MSKKRSLKESIEEMMFGFGDETWPPDEGAVDVMESIVLAYVQDLAARAKQVSLLTKKLDKDCFLYVVRKDMRKFRRVNDLLCANEELKGVQKNALPDESSI